MEEDILDDPGFSLVSYRGMLMPRWFRVITALVMITGILLIISMIVGMLYVYPESEGRQRLLLSVIIPSVSLLAGLLIAGTIGLAKEKKWAAGLSLWTSGLFFAYLVYVGGIRLYNTLNGYSSPKLAENIVLSCLLVLFLVFVLKLAGIREQWKTSEAKPKK